MAFPDDEIDALTRRITAAIAAASTSSASSASIDGASLSANNGSTDVDALMRQLRTLEDYKAKHNPYVVVSRWVPR